MSKSAIAFIFDLDGVLVSTSLHHYKAWQQIAHQLGIAIDETFNEQLKGVSRKESLEVILSAGEIEMDNELKSFWIDQKNKLYLEYISDLNSNALLSGVRYFLEQCLQNGIPMAVASASQNAQLILSKTQIQSFFHAIIDGNAVTQSKPHPEVFLKAAQALNTNPKDCIVFEDSKKGLLAAKSAGMYLVGIGESSQLQGANLIFEGFQNITPEMIIHQFQNRP